MPRPITQLLSLIDGPARKIVKSHGVACRGTLGLLGDAVREGALPVDLVSAVADDLIEGEYRLPFLPGGFAKWAQDNGVIPPEDSLESPDTSANSPSPEFPQE